MTIIVGTNSDDNLAGTANNDLIISGNGDDTIDGGDGNDLIFSGNGDDIVDGGDGNDVIVAGRGDDEINGGDGHDLIFGGKGDDTILGGSGNDLIFGGSGDDTIDGGEGCDIIAAGRGDDLVIFDVDENAGAQNYFSGGSGNDTLRLRLTQAQINEMTAAGVFAAFSAHVGSSSGFDFSTFGLSFAFNLKVWFFEQIEVEVTDTPALFTAGVDVVDFNTVLAGTYLDGTQYDGLDGDDTVTLANSAAAAAAAGFVVGTAFNAGEGNDTVNGGALDDVINGDGGNDILNGATGADTIDGGSGDDTITVQDAGDTLDGGAGVDDLIVDSNLDVTVDLRTGNLEIGVPTSTAVNFENVTTGGGNDTITGTDGDNIINSGGGNDFINALAGADTVNAGDGGDLLLVSDLAGDNANGGNGVDAVSFNFSQSVNFDLGTGAASLVAGGSAGTYMNFEGANIFGAGGATVTGTNVSNNILIRGIGNTVNLFEGNDNVDFNMGGNDADGGDGTFDSVRFDTSSNVILNLSSALNNLNIDGDIGTIVNFEVIRMGTGDDNIIGSAGTDRIEVNTGMDTVMTGQGNDVIFLNDGGGDTIDGEDGDNDTVFVSTTEDIVAHLGTDQLFVGLDAVSSIANIESIQAGSGNDTLTGSDTTRDQLIGNAGNDTLTSGRVNAGERDVLSGGEGNDTLIFNGEDVQANGGLGMDTFEFVDYLPGVGTQNALLFDVNVAEMDKIDVSSWALGLTPAQIAALAVQGPTANDSNLSLDGGDLTMTIFGISTAQLALDADDIFIV